MPDALLRRLTISTARVRDDVEGCCSATAALSAAAAAAAAERAARRVSVATPGPQARNKRSFVRPGGVGAAWARCVGAQKTVSVGRKRACDDATDGDAAGALVAAPPAAALYPRNLADMAVFLRHRKRRIVSEAAKLLAPQPAPAPGEELNLINLPVDLLMKIVCTLRHAELRPLLGTCTRLRQAAAAAISVHFNYCTPEPERDARDGVLAALRSPSPRFMQAALALAQDDGPAAPRRNRTRRRRPPRPPLPPDANREELPAPEPPAEAPMDATPAHAAGFASPQPQHQPELNDPMATPAGAMLPVAGADSPPRLGQRLSFGDDEE